MSKALYISGPIDGFDLEERRKAFKKATDKMLSEGWAVYNPMEKSGVPLGASREIHMREDLKLLLKSDAIYMMLGSSHSKGCQLEFEVAKQCGLEIIYQSPEDGEEERL